MDASNETDNFCNEENTQRLPVSMVILTDACIEGFDEHQETGVLKHPSPPEVELQRNRLLDSVRNRISCIQRAYHEDLAELSFIQSGALLIDFPSWKCRKSQELVQALCSGHLDPEDLATISSFIVGHLPPEEFFRANDYQGVPVLKPDGDSDDERGLDESSLQKLAMDELAVLKRVSSLKQLGLWSYEDKSELLGSENTPSLSSLSAPQEATDRTYNDYLFAELQWLAEDFKRERHWKRVCAKKLAIAAVKCHREKTERTLKAEKEEVVRIRKLCANIARMVRDWWRHMDKIVRAKQQARLAAKRQRAITTHLGQVLETTEQYTRWLTEGITGSKRPIDSALDLTDSTSDMAESVAASSSVPRSQKSKRARHGSHKHSDSSDAEFTADDETLAAAVDDEETIEREEQDMAIDQTTDAETEVAQLAAEADCPVEDLIPPGYLESLAANPDGFTDFEHEEDEKELIDEGSDKSFEAIKSDIEMDDESTIATQENFEAQEEVEPEDKRDTDYIKPDEEIAQLEIDASVPLEQLLSDYLKRQEESEPLGTDISSTVNDSNSEATSSVDESDVSESDSSSDESSVTDGSSSSSLRALINEPEAVASEPQGQATEKVSQSPATAVVEETTESANLDVLTAAALSAQPTGFTLDSTSSQVPVPFLLTGGNLREYQLVGLSWLATIYQKRLNGILADEMGLGKTIQTIALLAYLACEHGTWGPHLIVVPTSVILNWELEFKRWCPGFKILAYYGTQKERKEKRKGWSKTNAFHVCITSYKLAIQDANAFKRKKWKYVILDEAQNIKNFKSQRWQTLLTFNSQRRLLLTGTPLQNSLMELWSLMHFLMPNIFQSHREFQDWFASPLTGMIEGNREYNEHLVTRLHKVLRPFLLRRLKVDVERQMPKKFEHVIMCRLSRRQRFLYDDFMSLSATRETLKVGQFLSVMNVLMQLRKVCNHPNLFETRPIISPFHIDPNLLQYTLPRLVSQLSHPFLVFAPRGGAGWVCSPSAFTEPDLDWLDRAGASARLLGQANNLVEMTRDLPTFVRTRCRNLCARSGLITMVDTTGVVDDVLVQRNQLPQAALDRVQAKWTERRKPPSFISRNVINTVHEQLFPPPKTCRYPILPKALPVQPVMVEAVPPTRTWNSGMPKSVLRTRSHDRRSRLAFIARLNERRCDFIDFNESSSPIDILTDWNSRIGPDTVYFITRLLNDSNTTTTPTGSIYPGLVQGRSACQSSLEFWLTNNLYSPDVFTHRISRASCLPTDCKESIRRFGPEASHFKHCRWDRNCANLRKFLYNPADYLEKHKEIINRFAFAVPTAISAGFTVHVSCSKYKSQIDDETQRLRAMLADSCLPNDCLHSSTESSGSKRSSIITLPPFSPLAWLHPLQLHRIATNCLIQFPDPRLIQYDCGKLQRLALLLRELKAGDHRVLIFTQMARMLDILEQFLAYHGHCYLRLDGTTKTEQRQVLMERFNQDRNIFIFILSTRSGGLGVNLTGADTVIFYDSDWNPTMDAQAQDRCHRIGQTRDVHIYRLISERTVEENILRKANQKRFLSDVAIEGGRFTTAFFRQNTISELFAEPSGLQDLVTEKQLPEPSTRDASQFDPTAASGASNSGPSEAVPPTVIYTRSGRQVRSRCDAATFAALTPSTVLSTNENQLAALMETCEDENDRIATKLVMDEARADMAEFDETIPFEEGSVQKTSSDAPNTSVSDEVDPLTRYALSKKRQQSEQEQYGSVTQQVESVPVAANNDGGVEKIQDDPSELVERELQEFESSLKPVERFAVRLVEEQSEDVLHGQLSFADAELIESEKNWKLDQLKALHQADEERADVEEDDMLYYYGNYDPASSQLAELARLDRIIAEEEEADAAVASTQSHRNRQGRKQTSIKSKVSVQIATPIEQFSNISDMRNIDTGGMVDADSLNLYNDAMLSNMLGQRSFYNEESDSSVDDQPSTAPLHTNRKISLPVHATGRERKESFHNSKRPRSDDHRRYIHTNGYDIGLPNARSFYRPSSQVSTTTSLGKRKSVNIDSDNHFIQSKVAKSSYSHDSAHSNRQYRSRGRPLGSDRNRVNCGDKPNILKKVVNLTSADEMMVQSIRSSNEACSTRPPYIDKTYPKKSFEDSGTLQTFDSQRMDPLILSNVAHEEVVDSAQRISPAKYVPSDQHHYEVPYNAYSSSRTLQDNSVQRSIPVMTAPHLQNGAWSDSSSVTSFASSSSYSVQATAPQPTVSQSPRMFTFPTVPVTSVPTIQRPPEPVFPVQSVLNGARMSIPAAQLFTPTGQPVFVITRQMKTQTGEVYQQRFTHPVVPPPQFTQVVQRLARPTSTTTVRQDQVLLTNTQMSPISISSTMAPVAVCHPTVVASPRLPIIRLNANTRIVDQEASRFTVNDAYPKPPSADTSINTPRLAVNPTYQTITSIPVIRMINCDVGNKANPLVRLVATESCTGSTGKFVNTSASITNVPVNQVNLSPAFISASRTGPATSGQRAISVSASRTTPVNMNPKTKPLRPMNPGTTQVIRLRRILPAGQIPHRP